MLGVEIPQRPNAREESDWTIWLRVPTQVPGLMLSPQLYSVGSTVPTRPGRKPRWARGLRQMDVDYVLLRSRRRNRSRRLWICS